MLRLEQLINVHKPELTQTELMLWNYICSNRVRAAQMTIHELAEQCTMSTATIVRFAKKLGLEGFADLKALLKVEEVPCIVAKGDAFAEARAFYLDAWDRVAQRDFSEANELLYRAKRIFAYATGYVQHNVLNELKRMFFYGGVFICDIEGEMEYQTLMKSLTTEDLVIIISLSGETLAAVDFAQRLSVQGVPVISITLLSENTLAGLSTVNLYILAKAFQLTEGKEQLPFKSMMTYFLLTEIWYMKYERYLETLSRE